MSYKAKCETCLCEIHMEDDYNEGDDRRCEECRVIGEDFNYSAEVKAVLEEK